MVGQCSVIHLPLLDVEQFLISKKPLEDCLLIFAKFLLDLQENDIVGKSV